MIAPRIAHNEAIVSRIKGEIATDKARLLRKQKDQDFQTNKTLQREAELLEKQNTKHTNANSTAAKERAPAHQIQGCLLFLVNRCLT